MSSVTVSKVQLVVGGSPREMPVNCCSAAGMENMFLLPAVL